MTDMRERVARALIDRASKPGGSGCNATGCQGDGLDNDVAKELADAALLACGYEDMRQALEELHIASARVIQFGASVGSQWSYLSAALITARSVLERSKGDKT